MSQRRFHSNGHAVLTGWDRPLQQFFLVVESDAQAAGPSDAYVYSNLADPDFQSDPDFIVAKCDALGLTVPDGLVADLVSDAARDAGNERHDYGEVP